MYTEISAAVQSLKTLGTLVKAANTLSNYNELAAAVSEVNTKLMDATAVALASQEKQSELTTRIKELEEELSKYTNWEREIERYSLQSFPPGVLAYSLKSGMENGEPAHLLCANCANNRQKAFLQVLSEGEHGKTLICHKCSSKIRIEYSKPPSRLNTDYDQSGGPESWMR
jgi:formate dehydrogenase maturation protein FdhE